MIIIRLLKQIRLIPMKQIRLICSTDSIQGILSLFLSGGNVKVDPTNGLDYEMENKYNLTIYCSFFQVGMSRLTRLMAWIMKLRTNTTSSFTALSFNGLDYEIENKYNLTIYCSFFQVGMSRLTRLMAWIIK